MNSTWVPLTAVAVVFAALAGVAGWWNQRRTINLLRAQLARNEEARAQLAECLLQERRRIEDALARTGDDKAERRAALEKVLDSQPDTASAEFPWLETLPSIDLAESQAHVDLPA